MLTRFAHLLSLVAVAIFASIADAQFTDGHYFSTRDGSNEIVEANSAGDIVGSIAPALATNESIRGTAFGPDGLLYAVVPSSTGTARVISMDAAGAIQDSYYFTSFSGGNISYGKIAFGDSKFYVTSGAGLVEFTIGDAISGNLLNGSGAYDVEHLPNGNLLVAESYGIKELTPSGTVVRTINLSDPYGNALGASVGFTDVRSLAYDPSEDILYATHLGHSGFNFRLMKIEAATGYLLDHEYFWYGDEIALNDDGVLAVASRTQAPGLFNSNLNFLGSFESNNGRLFVSQFQAVPEPLGLPVFALITTLLTCQRRRRG